MLILDLVNSENSDIKYKISKFPDGQQNITLVPDFSEEARVAISSRLNNWLDLELIVGATACLREEGVKDIKLAIAYFMGARSDRKFEEGGNNYLKQVICPIINSLGFEAVGVLDPHSNVLEACLNNFKKTTNAEFVEWAIRDIIVNSKVNDKEEDIIHIGDIIYIAPDAGAAHKIYATLKEARIDNPIVIICSKERDAQGNLTKVVVPDLDKFTNQTFVVIDDICDGGRTFTNIVKYIEETDQSLIPNRKYLLITHGIFSNGFKDLSQYFDGLYSTNSYSSIGDYAGNGMEKTNLKQFNLFE